MLSLVRALAPSASAALTLCYFDLRPELVDRVIDVQAGIPHREEGIPPKARIAVR